MADFADLKSPYSLGHSRNVAVLAARAAERCGLTGDDVSAVERAGLLHDIGAVAVSSGIWCKTGALSESETERELSVLRLLARGRSTKEIAAALGIAPKTADNHVQSVYSKIHVSTRAGATLFAVEHGLLDDAAG